MQIVRIDGGKKSLELKESGSMGSGLGSWDVLSPTTALGSQVGRTRCGARRGPNKIPTTTSPVGPKCHTGATRHASQPQKRIRNKLPSKRCRFLTSTVVPDHGVVNRMSTERVTGRLRSLTACATPGRYRNGSSFYLHGEYSVDQVVPGIVPILSQRACSSKPQTPGGLVAPQPNRYRSILLIWVTFCTF